jgi:hypothetical protein
MITKYIHNDYKKFVIKEYSEGLIKKLITKYTKQHGQLAPETIRRYVERHEELKDVLDDRYKNIQSLSWTELEGAVDSYRSNKETEEAGGLQAKAQRRNDPNILVDENGIVLFKAPDVKACQKYGVGANYCVKHKDMFQKYRRDRGGSVAYFIFNENLPREDSYYRVVIHAYMDGTFLLTDAFNNHDNEILINSEQELLRTLETEGNWNDTSMLVGKLEPMPLNIKDLYPDLRFENGKYIIDGNVNLADMGLTELPKYWEALEA